MSSTSARDSYTDMNAIRRDEEVDNLHSIYVDQWDWEKVITPRGPQRAVSAARPCAPLSGAVVRDATTRCSIAFPQPAHKAGARGVSSSPPRSWRTAGPTCTPKEREDAICREHRTVFLMQIGGNLKRSGKPHDGRAPDYDDWSLNGDILMWNEVLRACV